MLQKPVYWAVILYNYCTPW